MTALPATVASLDHIVVVDVLARPAGNITDAAQDLGVPPSDLRRLVWANPKLMDAALEIEEARLDVAEKNIAEALHSDDPRRRDAASMFTLRNSARARRRGWITSSSSTVDLNINANTQPRQIVFRWRNDDDDKVDAEAERLREEGNKVNPDLGRIACGQQTHRTPSRLRGFE